MQPTPNSPRRFVHFAGAKLLHKAGAPSRPRLIKALGRKEITMNWPDDSDGDVFRRLEADGFDFSKSYAIDYNVDFDSWPPLPEAIERLRKLYGDVEIFNPDEEGDGYVLFQVFSPVTYERVTTVQRQASAAMGPYGGICESWGVLH